MKRFVLLTLCTLLLGCSRESAINYGAVPEFSLIDEAGKTFTLGDLKDKVWIADFIFTHCAGTCPEISTTMRRLQNALPREIHLVSFSVDPARDNPDVLSSYADQFQADKTRWHFLTGEKNALYDLSIKGFKLALEDTGGPETEPITHSTRLVLVDKRGQIRGYYGGTDEAEWKKLFTDAIRLL